MSLKDLFRFFVDKSLSEIKENQDCETRSAAASESINDKQQVASEPDINRQPTVSILHSWKKGNGFFAPGVAIFVENGKGLLREAYTNEITEYCYGNLMFGDKTLFQLQGGEYYCPTCEKIVKSGYNLEQTKEFSFDAINSEDSDFEAVVEQMKPLLGLLKSDYYFLWDTELYPTDGNGNLFWDFPNEDIPMTGSCVYYRGACEWGLLTPHFTIATQPKAKFNKERAEYYRDKPGARAIAYYMDGNLTALLDGHHKAMAAAMEHRKVRAVVISRCSYTVWQDVNKKKEKFLIANDARFNFSEPWIDERKIESVHVATKKVIRLEPVTTNDETEFDFDTKKLAYEYPTVSECASIDYFDEINDELIDAYLRGEFVNDTYKCQNLIEALGAIKSPRLFEVIDHCLYKEFDKDLLYFAAEQIEKQMERGNNLGQDNLQDYLIEYMTKVENEYPELGKKIFEML